MPKEPMNPAILSGIPRSRRRIDSQAPKEMTNFLVP